MPKKKKEEYNTTKIQSEIKTIQSRYTDNILKQIVSNHSLLVNMTPPREKWLWEDALHTSKLLQDCAKHGIMQNLLTKAAEGKEVHVIEFGCGGRGPSMVMNLAHLFRDNFRYLGIDEDWRTLTDSRSEFQDSKNVFFEHFNSGSSIESIVNLTRIILGFPHLEQLLEQKNITHPDLILFRHALVLNVGEISSPYAYFAYLLTEKTPQLFNGASLIVTTYLDWEQDVALRYLLISYPYLNKIISQKFEYPCHYHWRVGMGFTIYDKNVDQFYIGISQYQYHETHVKETFNFFLPPLPYIIVSQIISPQAQKYFPKLVYFPLNFASLLFMMGYNYAEELAIDWRKDDKLSSPPLKVESVMIHNLFFPTLVLCFSVDLYKMTNKGPEKLLLSSFGGLVLAWITNRLMVAYIPSSLGYHTHLESNLLMKRTHQSENQSMMLPFKNASEEITDQSNNTETNLSDSTTQNFQCSSASRISSPFWFDFIILSGRLLKNIPTEALKFWQHLPSLHFRDSTTKSSSENNLDQKQSIPAQSWNLNSTLSLLLIPATKIGNSRQAQRLSDNELIILKKYQDQLESLEEKRIKPVLQKIKQFGYNHESPAVELNEMHHRVRSLINQGISTQKGGKLLINDVRRFMDYLKARLSTAERFLNSYRFFTIGNNAINSKFEFDFNDASPFPNLNQERSINSLINTL